MRNQEGELEATNIMVLHSANEEKISRITWTMNKQGVMTTEERQVSPEQPFVVVIPALEKKGNTNKPSVLVTFLNDKGKVVQTANA